METLKDINETLSYSIENWKILQEIEIPDPNLPLEKSVCRSGSNS